MRFSKNTHYACALLHAVEALGSSRGPECDVWTLHLSGDGYGTFDAYDDAGVRHKYAAHRVAYERVFGPIPAGLTVDHLCRNRACINVDHLELVTRGENTHRGLAHKYGHDPRVTCANGHEWTTANTYHNPGKAGRRVCRACVAASQQRRRDKLARCSA